MIRLVALSVFGLAAVVGLLLVVAGLMIRARRRPPAPAKHLGGYFQRQLERQTVSRVTSTREPSARLPRSEGFVRAREEIRPSTADLWGTLEPVSAGPVMVLRRRSPGEDPPTETFATGDRSAAFDALRAQAS